MADKCSPIQQVILPSGLSLIVDVSYWKKDPTPWIRYYIARGNNNMINPWICHRWSDLRLKLSLITDWLSSYWSKYQVEPHFSWQQDSQWQSTHFSCKTYKQSSPSFTYRWQKLRRTQHQPKSPAPIPLKECTVDTWLEEKYQFRICIPYFKTYDRRIWYIW